MNNDILGFDVPETSSARTTVVRGLGFKYTTVRTPKGLLRFEFGPTNLLTRILFVGVIIGIPVGTLMLAVYGFVRLVGFIFG